MKIPFIKNTDNTLIKSKAMNSLKIEWIQMFYFVVFVFKDGKFTSIMNDVVIKENELRPPTLLNHTFDANKTEVSQSDGNKLEFLKPTTLGLSIPLKHNRSQNDNEVIGSTKLDLSGIYKLDNTETLLGNTVADAFLMNSWDDTEIR